MNTAQDEGPLRQRLGALGRDMSCPLIVAGVVVVLALVWLVWPNG